MSFKDILRGKKRFNPQDAELDMTPMVDVTFQLLIFFMLTASFVRQRSLPVPKPKDESSQNRTITELQESDDTVTVRIDEHGTYYVSAPNLDEVEVPSRNELFAKLRQARMPDAAGHIPNRLLVLAHGDAEHGRVVSAIDAGNESGMESVQVVTQDEENAK